MALVSSFVRSPSRGISRPMVRKAERLDTDALAFFARASVTNSTGRSQVSKFVKGLKTLGEWGNVYNAWTLRDYQAGGLSSTLYGLKTGNDATLVGGPTWGADGITFDRVDDSISLSTALGVFRNTNAGHVVGVYKKGSSTAGQDIIHIAGGTTGQRARIMPNNKTSYSKRLDGDGSTITAAATGDANRNYDELRLDWAGGFLSYLSNGISISSPAAYATVGFTSDTDSIHATIGANNGSSAFFGGEISFLMLMRSLPSLARAEQIRALYKSTLGLGLGLS